jgi:predicted Zn-dependent protease
MTAALQRDSSFAMAAYWVWQLGRSHGDDTQSQNALSRAKRLAPRAIDRERLLIQGSAAELDGPVSRRTTIAETLSVRYPEDPDGQYLLGAARFHAGDWPGSVAAYNRAVALDSAAGATTGPCCRVCTTLSALSQTYLWWDSLPTAERSMRRLIAFRPEEASGWINLVEPLLRQGRRGEAERAFERGAVLGTGNLTVRGLLNRDLIRWGRFEEVDRELLSDLFSAAYEERAEGRWLMLISLRNQGRLREALALTESGRIPGSDRSVQNLGTEGQPRRPRVRDGPLVGCS